MRTLINVIIEKARREGGICNSRVIMALPNNFQYFSVFFVIIERARDGGICNSRVIMALPNDFQYFPVFFCYNRESKIWRNM